MTVTPLEKERLKHAPKLPSILESVHKLVTIESGDDVTPSDSLNQVFPHTLNQKPVSFNQFSAKENTPIRVGVVLSGGQAPGGHNVICGLYDALQKIHSDSKLYGFLDGPIGIIENDTLELTGDIIDRYRNMGGFDMIASGRTKIETPEQFAASAETAKALDLDGIVVIGGDDSNTNAALLAEYFKASGVKTHVVGAPKTIDGDLKNENIEVSFGFDTASKTFSSIIGNIARDCLSAKKYYYFIKLMGRSASHITLECALQTQPNYTLIGEEVADQAMTLKQVVEGIATMICQRSEDGKNYGVILVPEGIIEFIPEFKILIGELNKLLADDANLSDHASKLAYVNANLSQPSQECFNSLPEFIQRQLLLDRDSHGNVQVSKIESERLLIDMVKSELKKRKSKGQYSGKFSAQPHFCGYEGRSCLPSNFDCNYCYGLGFVAASLLNNGCTGYIASLKNLTDKPENWISGGYPLTQMINFEERHGEQKPVIEKALVELEGAPFAALNNNRQEWMVGDHYRYAGPIQFFGDASLTDEVNMTLQLESER